MDQTRSKDMRTPAFDRNSGAPKLEAKAFLASPKGQETIRKAARLATRLKLESVGTVLASTPNPVSVASAVERFAAAAPRWMGPPELFRPVSARCAAL